MTVCIAAITQQNEIVTVSDTMLTHARGSADAVTSKMDPFAKEWCAMWAADDMTQCAPIIEKAERYFRNRANTLQVARSCMKRAYQKHLSEIAADRVLGRFQMDVETFTKSGKRRFTETQFNSLNDEIRKVEWSGQFLAFGFDQQRQPHIFTVVEPGIDCVYDRVGFCAIGSGGMAAESLLFHLRQTRICTFANSLINCLFAKFMAEGAGAGRQTFVFCKKFGSTMYSMPIWLEPTARQIWEERVSPRTPDDFLHCVASAVSDGQIYLG
jgi:hypothetical protein